MKILKSILLYAMPALMLCLASCDYLDKEPENKVPEQNIDFTKIENMYQAVSGVYAKVRTGGCTGLSGRCLLSGTMMFGRGV